MGNDIQLFKDLVVMFTEDAPKRLEAMYAAVEAQKWNDVEQQAHSLRGLVSNFGTDAAAYHQLAIIEDSIAAGDYAEVSTHREELNASLKELESKLQGFVKDDQA